MVASLTEGLRTPLVPLVFIASLLLWGACYQVKSTYTVDVGGLTDDAYLSDFHAKEKADDQTYRWSRGGSVVDLPGVGNQPVKLSIRVTGFRPDGPPPKISILARRQKFEIQTESAPKTYTLFVDRGDRWEGDFRINISSPTFTPPGDLRELGVLLDSVAIEPADYGLRPFVIPPVWTLLSLMVGVGLAYLGALITLRKRALSLALLASLAVAVGVLIVIARPELGLLARGLPGLMLWTLAVALLGRLLLDFLSSQVSGRRIEFARAAGSGAAALAFLLRFGGLKYPQFLTSDLLLHVHYVQGVLRGNIFITGFLPDGPPVPYPPALYVIAAPMSILLGSSDESLGLLLKWLISALDATTCLALAWAGIRLLSSVAGGLGALAYALSPAPFELMSAGNYSNLFAQALLNICLLGGVVYVGRKNSPQRRYLVFLGIGFFLTALGHYGVMLSMLVLMGLFGALTIWTGTRKKETRQSKQVIAAFGAGVLASVLVFYLYFAREIADQFAALFQRLTGGRGPGDTPLSPPPASDETLFQKFGRKLARLSGILPIMAGVGGLFVMDRYPEQARNLIVAWLGAAGFFFLLDQALGDTIRWYYLAAAPISLLAGRFLGLVAAKGRSAVTLVGFCFAVMLLQLLYIWVGDLIFTRYH
jgi:hypothetical protein